MQNNITQKHPFHLVDPSPWPLITAISCFLTTIGAAMYLHLYKNGGLMLIIGLLMVIISMFLWWKDVIDESTYLGHHTYKVQTGLRYGVILFIVSEIMFFFAFFWAFFHSSLAPTIEIGALWPPRAINPFNPWDVPFLNTLILLLSGATCTVAHHEITLHNNKKMGKRAFLATLILAITFTFFQIIEYLDASFKISDGIYGSTFYLATGFHGFHVLIGTIFLGVCFYRYINNHFTKTHHLGFEAAAWYWHFVDVVWLFLFVSIYWWGNTIILAK